MGLMNDFYSGGVDFTSQLLMSRKNTPSVKIDFADDEQSLPFSDEFLEDYDSDTDEGRLSRALQSWMSDYEIVPIFPRNRPAEQPIYSGKVGKDLVLKRSESEESLLTGISLFSCSECEIATSASTEDDSRKRRRRKIKSPARSDVTTPQPSKWVELSSRKRGGIFETFMRNQNALTLDVYQNNGSESEAFELMDEDEKVMLFSTGSRRGIRLINNLKKSGSMSNLNDSKKVNPSRCLSAGSKRTGKPINLEEYRQQMINQKLAMLQKQNRGQGKFKKQPSSSRLSVVSDISSDFVQETPTFRSLESSSEEQEPKEEKVSMWKGDREILEIDLRRGLSNKVQRKIQSTTTALARVTGHGETNEFQKSFGRSEEYPHLVEEDYGSLPKIIQKIRVSPHLSDVIKNDIKIRMGRPRYHEICKSDLIMWNKGQSLNRAHRNLKVFNWLHSLREDEFENHKDVQIDDSIPENINEIAILRVESADDPDTKPLYLKEFKMNTKVLPKINGNVMKSQSAKQLGKSSMKPPRLTSAMK